MKSAYELAMERLEQQSPTVKLTESQRAEIAKIDDVYRARIAEKEVFLGGEVEKARSAGDHDEIHRLEEQLAREKRRLAEESEAKKDKIRKAEG